MLLEGKGSSHCTNLSSKISVSVLRRLRDLDFYVTFSLTG